MPSIEKKSCCIGANGDDVSVGNRAVSTSSAA
jgi:hypothetical protein